MTGKELLSGFVYGAGHECGESGAMKVGGEGEESDP